MKHMHTVLYCSSLTRDLSFCSGVHPDRPVRGRRVLCAVPGRQGGVPGGGTLPGVCLLLPARSGEHRRAVRVRSAGVLSNAGSKERAAGVFLQRNRRCLGVCGCLGGAVGRPGGAPVLLQHSRCHPTGEHAGGVEAQGDGQQRRSWIPASIGGGEEEAAEQAGGAGAGDAISSQEVQSSAAAARDAVPPDSQQVPRQQQSPQRGGLPHGSQASSCA